MSKKREMTSGEIIKINAMRKEIARLEAVAKRWEEKEKRVIHCGSAIMKIHIEFCEVAHSSLPSAEKLKKMEALQAKDKEERRFLCLDPIKIMDESFAAKMKVEELKREIDHDLFIIRVRIG